MNQSTHEQIMFAAAELDTSVDALDRRKITEQDAQELLRMLKAINLFLSTPGEPVTPRSAAFVTDVQTRAIFEARRRGMSETPVEIINQLAGVPPKRGPMTTIYKYMLEPGHNEIVMPAGAEILSVQTQKGAPFVWALVDTNQPPCTVMLSVYGTGHSMPQNPGKYVGTFQIDGGALVWHLFETARLASNLAVRPPDWKG